MAKTPNKLSDTARAMLTLAATREDRLVRPPTLPAAAARQVVRSLLNNSFAEEIPAPIEDAAYTWRTTDDGSTLMLHATDAGLAAAGVTPVAAEPPQTIEAFTQAVIGFLAEEGCVIRSRRQRDEIHNFLRASYFVFSSLSNEFLTLIIF